MTLTAWDLIGFPRTAGEDQLWIRVQGGRALYEAASFDDSGRATRVRLSRLDVTPDGLHQVDRYVDPDTVVEVVSR